MMPDGSALVFLNNHDNQRSHGGGGNVITFEDPYSKKPYNVKLVSLTSIAIKSWIYW